MTINAELARAHALAVFKRFHTTTSLVFLPARTTTQLSFNGLSPQILLGWYTPNRYVIGWPLPATAKERDDILVHSLQRVWTEGRTVFSKCLTIQEAGSLCAFALLTSVDYLRSPPFRTLFNAHIAGTPYPSGVVPPLANLLANLTGTGSLISIGHTLALSFYNKTYNGDRTNATTVFQTASTWA